MGYPTTTQSSGQFSFNAFRTWWINTGGTNWGTNLQGWCGRSYFNAVTSDPGVWPSTNMHLFLFYNVSPFAGGGPPGGGGGK